MRGHRVVPGRRCRQSFAHLPCLTAGDTVVAGCRSILSQVMLPDKIRLFRIKRLCVGDLLLEGHFKCGRAFAQKRGGFPQLVVCDWFNSVQIAVQMGYTPPGLASVFVAAKQLAFKPCRNDK